VTHTQTRLKYYDICLGCIDKFKGIPIAPPSPTKRGKCPYCNSKSLLMAVTDYRWPKDVKVLEG